MHYFKTSTHNGYSLIRERVGLWCLVLLLTGCTSAELTRLTVDEATDKYYRYIFLNVDLSNSTDTAYLANRLINRLEAYDLQIKSSTLTQPAQDHDVPPAALLKVEELGRRIEAGEHRRTYGRTSLTQMRGRKKHERPVITLRAILVDAQSGQTLFQADYNTEGPWHADSTTVVAALADTLLDQLAHKKFIAVKESL
jgi:hypothetical protein